MSVPRQAGSPGAVRACPSLLSPSATAMGRSSIPKKTLRYLCTCISVAGTSARVCVRVFSPSRYTRLKQPSVWSLHARRFSFPWIPADLYRGRAG